jgi:hypothetical protein
MVWFLQHNKHQYAFSVTTICLVLVFVMRYLENLVYHHFGEK